MSQTSGSPTVKYKVCDVRDQNLTSTKYLISSQCNRLISIIKIKQGKRSYGCSTLKIKVKRSRSGQEWVWSTPVTPAMGRLKQGDYGLRPACSTRWDLVPQKLQVKMLDKQGGPLSQNLKPISQVRQDGQQAPGFGLSPSHPDRHPVLCSQARKGMPAVWHQGFELGSSCIHSSRSHLPLPPTLYWKFLSSKWGKRSAIWESFSFGEGRTVSRILSLQIY